jgi:hypothetical protein
MADIRADLDDGVLIGRTVKRDRIGDGSTSPPSKPHPFQPVSRLLACSALRLTHTSNQLPPHFASPCTMSPIKNVLLLGVSLSL